MAFQEDHTYSDQELLKGLVEQNHKLLTALYRRFYPSVANYVLQHGGQEVDAEDVFQEGLVILFRKAPTLNLTSSLLTYFMAICKRIWWNRMRDFKKRPLPLKEEIIQGADDDLMIAIEQSEKYQLYQEKFSMLGTECQRLLKLFFAGTRMQEICEAMGLSSVGYAKKRKYLCKNRLVKMVQEDPRYQEIITKP